MAFIRDTYRFNFPGPPSELVDAFRRYYGPTMNAFEAAEKNGRADDLRQGIGRAVREPEHQPTQGRHFDPGDLPARDGCGELGGCRRRAKRRSRLNV